ncbi:MAG: 5-formyltetrahydrofolate cyclo-ligase [Pseudomonadota bacterium]
MTDNPDAAKAALRTVMKDIRAAATKAARYGSGLQPEVAMNERLRASGLIQPENIVAVFIPIGSELDAVTVGGGLGAGLALPVMQGVGQPLIFRAWRPGEPLAKRQWGISEPLDTAPDVRPDVFLIPLLAVDHQGYRLGYGGGFYDRTLERLRGDGGPLTTIGLALEAQIREAVPRGPHDLPVDTILTPERLIQIAPGDSSYPPAQR